MFQQTQGDVAAYPKTHSDPLSPLAMTTALVWSNVLSHESSMTMEAVSENTIK